MGAPALMEKAGISPPPPAKARSRASATRHAPRDAFIVDFVGVKHRLIVEVDGGRRNFDVHASPEAKRDNHFIGQGFRVLRFWNHELDRNLEGVLMTIDDAVRNPPPGLASLGHPPPAGEG